MTSLSLYTKLETLPKELKEEARIFIEKLVEKAKRRKEEKKKSQLQNQKIQALVV